MLRKNQNDAVVASVKNNFKSGVHCHATGTGKSWIALELILEFNKKYPNSNILWLCEQKSILIEQFNRDTIIEKGYQQIFDIFKILDYTVKKPKDWYLDITQNSRDSVPLLIIINRAFLVSKCKYKLIEAPINLIIHDECHSITNKTTTAFYNWILEKYSNASCLGFSATPNIGIKPFDNVITHYSIFDAYCDNVILGPKIKWVDTDYILSDLDIVNICKEEIDKLHYKKIIIWCGMIDLCEKLANIWKDYFKDFLIAIDTSNSNKNYNEFKDTSKNAILFCARKNREGSDIKNLDGCIFVDKVENRNPKTFVQCIGRVLRKDKENKKKYGLVIDLKASSCLKICDRMNYYLNSNEYFPWKYFYYYKKLNNKKVLVNQLELTRDNTVEKQIHIDYSVEDLINKFNIKCPEDKKYTDRLQYELELINEKKLVNYLIRAIEILKLTNYIPHVTRGSCGSSLVCYLLGISNVDPVKHNIKFERFLNSYRNNLPDIDLDFPHYLRDEVFLKLELTWPNQVARISNHVNWHEKSATREALRKIGIRKQIPKEEIHSFISKLPFGKRIEINKIKNELENTFRHYSLHCGGIVFFHDGIPDEIKLKNNNEIKTMSQIVYDKNDISKQKRFKIDILSSRGISQLVGICGNNIDFSDCPYDEKTYKLLQSGENIGITLGESPLMRKALLKIKPKSISDIATCLAIIRPAAKDARMEDNDIDFESKFVFDDDAIRILSKMLNISDSLADKFRRCIAKDKWEPELEKQYKELVKKLTTTKREYLLQTLSNLKKYSFCKSHSYSYAQLVYKLAYQKAHNPTDFWVSTLRHSSSSYRKWVHLYQAKLSGVNVMDKIMKSKDISIYAENRRKKFSGLDIKTQLKTFGYWDMSNDNFYPNCYFYNKEKDIYYFCGIIATLRVLSYNTNSKKIVAYVGVGKNKFIELIVKYKYYNAGSVGIKGRAKLLDETTQTYETFIHSFF